MPAIPLKCQPLKLDCIFKLTCYLRKLQLKTPLQFTHPLIMCVPMTLLQTLSFSCRSRRISSLFSCEPNTIRNFQTVVVSHVTLFSEFHLYCPHMELVRQMLISKSPDSEDLWIGFPKVFHGNFHYPHSCLLVLSRETFGSNKHDQPEDLLYYCSSVSFI